LEDNGANVDDDHCDVGVLLKQSVVKHSHREEAQARAKEVFAKVVCVIRVI